MFLSIPLSSLNHVVRIALWLGIGRVGVVAASRSHRVPQAAPACRLDAFTPAERARHVGDTARLLAAVERRRELARGYRYEIAAGKLTMVELAQWAEAERKCCPFIEFEIRQGADGGPLALTLTGSAGVKKLLGTTFSVEQALSGWHDRIRSDISLRAILPHLQGVP